MTRSLYRGIATFDTGFIIIGYMPIFPYKEIQVSCYALKITGSILYENIQVKQLKNEKYLILVPKKYHKRIKALIQNMYFNEIQLTDKKYFFYQ